MTISGLKKKILYTFKYLSHLLSQKPNPPQNYVASIRMKTVNRTRRLSQICEILKNAGFYIYIDISLIAYLRMNEYGKRLFKDPLIQVGSFSDHPTIIVTDSCELTDEKLLCIDYNLYTTDSISGDDLFLPIMFHPNLLNPDGYARASSLSSNRDRKIRVFFAGNIDSESYSREIAAGEKRYLNRSAIISALIRDGLDGRLTVPATWREFITHAQTGYYRDKFVIVDIDRFKIPHTDWLDTLSNSEFFLSPPGYTQPFCHNIVEAMAVGTVPITQYGDLFKPSLQDKRECISFNSLDELIDRMKAILKEDTLSKSMSADVLHYHDKYLSLSSAAQHIQSFVSDPERHKMKIFLAGGPIGKEEHNR